MTLSGGLSKTVLTDTNGYYSFTNLPAGSDYTLNTSPYFVSSPRNFPGFADIFDNNDYVIPEVIAGATTHTIAGYLRTSGVGGLSYPGVTMTLTHPGCGTCTPIDVMTDANGGFTFSNLGSSTYTLTPHSRTDYAVLNFSPDSQTFTSLNNDFLSVSFQVTGVHPFRETKS